MKIMDTIGFVEGFDEEVGKAMETELARQRRNLELIASENIVSPAVMAAMGSVLTNKYAEGYPGKRYYGGCECVDVVEKIAIERACKLFGAKYANVQPHSGAQANTAVYFALLQPGDTVPDFEAAMAKLKPGQVSEPIRTPYGYHLIQVVERRTAKEGNPERVRVAARQAIRQKKLNEANYNWERELRDEAYVEIRDPQLKEALRR